MIVNGVAVSLPSAATPWESSGQTADQCDYQIVLKIIWKKTHGNQILSLSEIASAQWKRRQSRWDSYAQAPILTSQKVRDIDSRRVYNLGTFDPRYEPCPLR